MANLSIKKEAEFKAFCAAKGRSMTEVVDEYVDYLLQARNSECDALWEMHKAALWEEYVVSGARATETKDKNRKPFCDCGLRGCVCMCVERIAEKDMPNHYTLEERKARYEDAVSKSREALKKQDTWVWLGGYVAAAKNVKLKRGVYI